MIGKRLRIKDDSRFFYFYRGLQEFVLGGKTDFGFYIHI